MMSMLFSLFIVYLYGLVVSVFTYADSQLIRHSHPIGDSSAPCPHAPHSGLIVPVGP